ncbi:MAG: SPFH domain-containing protein, partial [Planctomycetota bacterium]|nr:SPFH domain-containing protein [Planctomycetota bacterium]
MTEHEHFPDRPADEFDPLAPCPCGRAGAGGDEAADAAAIAEDLAARSLAHALALGFGILKLAMVALAALFAIDRFTYIDQSEIGLVRRFGEYLRDERGAVRQYRAGEVVFLWPSPIEELDRIPLISLDKQRLLLEQEFWPKIEMKTDAAKEEGPAAPARERLDPAKDGYNLTGDLNILHSRWVIQYRVADPVRYLTSAVKPEEILRRIACSAVTRCLAGMPVDKALVPDEANLRNQRILEAIQAELRDPQSPTEWRWGIEATEVSALGAGVVPPGKVKADFDAVNGALSEKQSRIAQAQAEAKKIVENARKEANAIKQEALVYRKRVVEKARADADVLRALLAKFPNDPAGLQVALEQYRLALVREVLAKAHVRVIRPDERTVYIA